MKIEWIEDGNIIRTNVKGIDIYIERYDKKLLLSCPQLCIDKQEIPNNENYKIVAMEYIKNNLFKYVWAYNILYAEIDKRSVVKSVIQG